jgi:hypothetical protein
MRIVAILFCTLLMGCGGSGHGSPPNLHGNWHAILTSTASGQQCTLDLFILQNGATLSSPRILVAPCGSDEGTMSGSITGNAVNITITARDPSPMGITITGTVSGDSLSGSYTMSLFGNDDVGTISATLIPSVQGTSWTGSTHSTQNPPGDTTFGLKLAEDSLGSISGMLTFTGSSGSSSSCPELGGTISVGGQQTGNQVSLFDNKSFGLDILGSTDSAAKNFNGSYSCASAPVDFGDFTMSRP